VQTTKGVKSKRNPTRQENTKRSCDSNPVILSTEKGEKEVSVEVVQGGSIIERKRGRGDTSARKKKQRTQRGKETTHSSEQMGHKKKGFESHIPSNREIRVQIKFRT